MAMRSAPARAASSAVGEAAAAGALAVEADREPGSPPRRARRAPAAWCGSRRPGRVVDERTRRLSSGSSFACSTSVSIAPVATRAVDEPGVELLAGADDRLARLAQVGDVVQRVVQAEDVDAVLGRAGDEAAHDVGADRPASRRGSGRAARSRAASSCAPSSARIRSHGLSTPRRTAASKTPPPETSRQAKPARSSISASRSTSPVGTLPARGSCESRRIVVSTRRGTSGSLPSAGARPTLWLRNTSPAPRRALGRFGRACASGTQSQAREM